ncbi:MAG: HpcH/HpaI aldolase/citrate lyase family protein [Desulfobacterales bacterium]
METIDLLRSALFVPGNRPDRIDKAAATPADIVIIDLEDAVPIAEKRTVLPVVREKLVQHGNRRMMVRVNALETGLTEGDLAGIAGPGLHAVMLPKVQTAEDIVRVAGLLSAAEDASGIEQGALGLVALVETALGIENAFAIAAAKIRPRRLHTIAFGAADFSLDLGIAMTKSGEELAFPRARIAIACRAAGISPPLDTPYMIDLKDREAFEADVLRGKRLGFGGKLCIHPDQVDFCNRTFAPSEKEIAFAAKVVEAFEAAEAKGHAAIQVEGKFVDYPVVARSRSVLALAEKIARKATTDQQ